MFAPFPQINIQVRTCPSSQNQNKIQIKICPFSQKNKIKIQVRVQDKILAKFMLQLCKKIKIQVKFSLPLLTPKDTIKTSIGGEPCSVKTFFISHPQFPIAFFPYRIFPFTTRSMVNYLFLHSHISPGVQKGRGPL